MTMNASDSSITPHALRPGGGMKMTSSRMLIAAGFLWALSSSSALATPDRIVTVDEQLVGSNAMGFGILRTETDNLGSYYAYRTKRFLDDYSKSPDDAKVESVVAARIRSRLLLDVTYSIDPAHSGPQIEAAKSEKVNAKDDSIVWADILKEYPNAAARWEEKWFSRLTTDQAGGVFLGTVNIVWGETITKKVFEERLPALNWSLDEVVEDMNCLYLRISKRTGDEVRETRLVCIPPRKSRQAGDHLHLKPFYLIAGSYETEKEALQEALALLKKCKEKGYAGFSPEIWSVWKRTDKIVYVIADQSSMDHIKEESFTTLERVLGVDLVPLSSEFFREKTKVQ